MQKVKMLLISILLTSCSQEPDISKVVSNFNANINDFESLSEMVKEDYKSGICFEVGKDKIGEYYESGGFWGTEKLSLEKVLEKYSISNSRYKKYKELFKFTDTERVSYCNSKDGESYSLLTYRSGLGISGCSMKIQKEQPIPVSKGRRNNGEDFTEITILKNGWFIEYSCT